MSKKRGKPKKPDDFVKPESPAHSGHRRCSKCDEYFKSRDAGHRICPPCRRSFDRGGNTRIVSDHVYLDYRSYKFPED